MYSTPRLILVLAATHLEPRMLIDNPASHHEAKRQPARLAVMIPTLVEWLSRVDGVTVSNGDMAIWRDHTTRCGGD
jgi:hypothetical protein